MGFAFPKEERDALIQTWPEKFMQPDPGDLRYNWVHVRLDAIDEQELLELVFDAWRMVVPKRLAAASDDDLRLGRVADLVLSAQTRVELFGACMLSWKALTKWGIVVTYGKVGDR